MNKIVHSFFQHNPEPIIQSLELTDSSINIDVLREDLMFPVLSGNKFRKLKYHLLNHEFKRCISFGGNYSNHLYALAEAVHLFGFQCFYFHPKHQPITPTLLYAKKCGVSCITLNYSDFRKRYDPSFVKKLQLEYNADYYIPEGGAGGYGVTGCEEILDHPNIDLSKYDTIALACGTGTMLCGVFKYIIQNASHLNIIALSALKKFEHLKHTLLEHLTTEEYSLHSSKIYFLAETFFKGFGKYNEALISFMIEQYERNHIELDHVYTAKLLWYLLNAELPKTTKGVLLIHSGGLQGRYGMQENIKSM